MKTFIAISLIFIFVFGAFSFVSATDPAVTKAIEKVGQGFGDNTVSGGSDPAGKTQEIIGKIIKYVLGIIGTISLIVFIYSGIMWMLAGGNDTKIVKAEQAMVWAALGLFVVFISYTIITYLISKFSF